MSQVRAARVCVLTIIPATLFAQELTLSASQRHFTEAGGSASLSIAADGSWTASTNAPWLTLGQSAGSVSLSFTFQVAANSGSPRAGAIIVTTAARTQSVTITQVSAAPVSTGPGLRFIPVTPCRVVDTRGESGQTGLFGQPVMAAAAQRDFPIPAGACPVPILAGAYSLNVTVVPRGPLAFLTLWPAGQPRPLVSTLNSFDGRIKANAAIVPAGANGSISAYATGATDLILDLNGYFIPETIGPLTAVFHPLSPCRVADTRLANGPFGGPSLSAGQTRSFAAGSSACGTLESAVAYSLNITAIPKGGALSYATVWPWGRPRPLVSTLNSYTGTVVANAAIVPAGSNGEIGVFATDAADIVIDINGYFSTSAGAGMKYYPVAPCRVSDSRNAVGSSGGPIFAAAQERTVGVSGSGCGVPLSAGAYVLNATVVPSGPLSYLTVVPAGAGLPLVSTLNAFDGAVTSNALIVPAGNQGSISAYPTEATHLIVDVSGYFAF